MTEQIELLRDVEKVRLELAPVMQSAQALEVVDQGSYEWAMELGSQCSTRAKLVEEMFKPSKDAAHKAWKEITTLIASLVDPLEEAKSICAKKARVWAQAEAERVRLQQKEAEEKARKQAEAERLALAVQIEQKGDAKLADAVLARPVKVEPPAPVAAVPVSKAGRVQPRWKAEVTDLVKLIAAVAAGQVDCNVLTPNMAELNKRARVLKSTMSYPGVKVWDEGMTVFRR